MKQQTTNISLNTWLMIIALSIIWGGSFLFGRILMLEWPPFTVVFLRVLFAAIVLWIFVGLARKQIPISWKFAASLLLMGILNNVVPFSLILIGQKEIGSGLASVVNAMTPIWTLIIANALTDDEKITGNKILGIISGFAGVAVLVGTDLFEGLTASAFAQVAVLGATISYGFAGVWGKRFRSHDPVLVSTGQLTASSLVMLPVAVMLEDPFALEVTGPHLVYSMLGLSVLCTALAYILFFRILAASGATSVSLVTFLVPVSAILLGMVFLGENMDIGDVVGMVLIIIGLALVDGRVLERIRSSR